MLRQITYILIRICSLSVVCGLTCHAAPVRITGMGQYEVVDPNDGSSRIMEVRRFVVLVEGARYRISNECRIGEKTMKSEFGCDGVDTFIVTDRQTVLSRPDGLSGIILAGRFPAQCSLMVQAVWLGYCSSDYFQIPTNHTGLGLSDVLLWSQPDDVTNIVSCWEHSTLPKEITGWSRNRVNYTGTGQPIELKQYPNGFKIWKLVAGDVVRVGNTDLPRSIRLEGFMEKPKTEVISGDDTVLVRRVSFAADALEVYGGSFDALPSVPDGDLPVYDKRFLKDTGRTVLETHVVTSNGWPTRMTMAYKDLGQRARAIRARNTPDRLEPKSAAKVILTILGINLIILVVLIKAIRKKQKSINTNKTQ